MADAKITQLNELAATPDSSDVIAIVDDPAGTPETKKITYANLGISLNTTHRSSDGTDHANVVLNDTHRGSDGSDHTFIDQDITIGASPTLDGANITGVVSAITYFFQADMFENPNNADWTVNSLAGALADTNNAALIVRQMADATESGFGFTVYVPTGATNIVFDIVSRSEDGTSGNALPKLYVREISDNAAVESWSAGTNLTAVAMPANENFQFDTQSIALSTLGMTAGNISQFEFTRDGANGSDTLNGAIWTLLSIRVRFT